MRDRCVRWCRSGSARRGVAMVGVVLLLIVLQLSIAAMVTAGARRQNQTARTVETWRAFYAAEAGINMAMRELAVQADEDGDGGIATISDDGDRATDPSLGPARFFVVRDDLMQPERLVSTGRSGRATRRHEVTFE